jgi:hypothetical protein
MADREEQIFYFLVARTFARVQGNMEEDGMDETHITEETKNIDKIDFLWGKVSI